MDTKKLDLTGLTDAELSGEIARRAEAKEKAYADKHNAYFFALSQTLTADLIDVLACDHNYADCKDNDTYAYMKGAVGPRCKRCALIDIMNGSWPTPKEKNYQFSIDIQAPI